MSLGLKSLCAGILAKTQQISYVPVRFRYYAEKIARGPNVFKYGFRDRVFQKGVLGRVKDAPPLPGPEYMPKNSWSHERATFGQNDYIDILGDGKLRPGDVCYNVPQWLRRRRGNELQLLLVKQRVFRSTALEHENPSSWERIDKRIKYLHKYLNTKTKTGFMKR